LIDLLEVLPSGCLIFGNSRMTECSTIMLVPGFNDGILVEMGDLGMLKGKAKEMYKKMKGLEG
jgi:hypothetical protein